MPEIFNELKLWFEQYVEQFIYKNQKDQEQIDLKYHHSYRVLDEIINIARSLNLNEEDMDTAKIIGLFHDIGRFEQYDRYKTYSDARSLDHAELGVEILKKNNLLTKVDTKRREIIYRAISYHNKKYLSEKLFVNKLDGLRYAKMIRDADKLDIWNIFLKTYYKSKDKSNININLSSEKNISKEVYDKTKNREFINYQKIVTEDDLKLMQMGWVYDLNFEESLRAVKKRGYLDKIYQSMSPLEEAEEIYQEIKDYLNRNINIRI